MALMHVQGCPGVSRCDGGMSPHSPAQVMLAGGKARVRPALCYRGVVCGRSIPSYPGDVRKLGDL